MKRYAIRHKPTGDLLGIVYDGDIFYLSWSRGVLFFESRKNIETIINSKGNSRVINRPENLYESKDLEVVEVEITVKELP